MVSPGSQLAVTGIATVFEAARPGGYYDLVALSYSPQDGSKQNEFPVQVLVQ